ncbi:MAG: hypothetical protein LC778_09605, partial [Acidobacteria bacterium]|nr:hypothetical protein [Acidobacteriota bacterium]
LAVATAHLNRTKSKNKRAVISGEIRQFESKVKQIREQKQKLQSVKPAGDERQFPQERKIELQIQIGNLLADYGIDRGKFLTAEEKNTLAFDAPIARSLHDQFVWDLRKGKTLAVESIIYGTAPDLVAIWLIFISMPRRKFWRVIRDALTWRAELWRAIKTRVELPFATAVEVVIFDEDREPLAQAKIPINLDEGVSEENIRDYFPIIGERLKNRYGNNFEIRDMPVDWHEALVAGEPIALTAFEI